MENKSTNDRERGTRERAKNASCPCKVERDHGDENRVRNTDDIDVAQERRHREGCTRKEIERVRSQCGPCADPLTFTSRSNTWCEVLRNAGTDLEQLCALRNRLDVEYPWDAGYNTDRLLYNKRFNFFPQAIVFARDADDVAYALRWATERGLAFSVRSGGHSSEGFSMTTTGIVIDLSRINGLVVSDDGRTARVGAGALIGPTYLGLQNGADPRDPTTARHGPGGLMVPMGTCANVGVAGLTQGGGVGFLMRRWGLTSDSLVAAEVVLADGSRVRADARGPHADLFWALRGAGGGNFGIVTEFVFRTHRLRRVILFEIAFEWEDTVVVADAWQRWAPHAPRALTSQLAFVPSFASDTGGDGDGTNVDVGGDNDGDDASGPKARGRPSRGTVYIEGEWASSSLGAEDGDDDDNDEEGSANKKKKGINGASERAHRALVAALTEFKRAVAAAAAEAGVPRPDPIRPPDIREVSVLDAARHFTDRNARPPMSKVKSDFVYDPLPREALQRLVDAMSVPPHVPRNRVQCSTSPQSRAVVFQAMRGAIADVPADATAFFNRKALYWVEYVAYWTSPNDMGPNVEWVTRAWRALRKYVPGYAYVNFPDLGLEKWERAYWGPTLERLVAVKQRYDPRGLFCMPQSVPLSLP